MQMIVMHLIFGDQASPDKKSASHWLDARMRHLDDVMHTFESQKHRRFIKTHLPLDGLPFFLEAKYIVVGRDPRDVFMSLWNHYQHLIPEFYKLVNEEVANLVGQPLPPCPSSIGEFWHGWITQGWFDWEHEGYPFWSNLGHTQSWWNFRSLPNILFVHFNDLLADCRPNALSG
jgi:aryl sulfotransferase